MTSFVVFVAVKIRMHQLDQESKRNQRLVNTKSYVWYVQQKKVFGMRN